MSAVTSRSWFLCPTYCRSVPWNFAVRTVCIEFFTWFWITLDLAIMEELVAAGWSFRVRRLVCTDSNSGPGDCVQNTCRNVKTTSLVQQDPRRRMLDDLFVRRSRDRISKAFPEFLFCKLSDQNVIVVSSPYFLNLGPACLNWLILRWFNYSHHELWIGEDLEGCHAVLSVLFGFCLEKLKKRTQHHDSC